MAALIHPCCRPAAADYGALSSSSRCRPKQSPPFHAIAFAHSRSCLSFAAKQSPYLSETSHLLSEPGLSQLLQLSVDYCDVQLSRAVHGWIVKIPQDTSLLNSLITSYVRLDSLTYAGRVFDSITFRNVVSYTAMISGLAKSNREGEAVGLFLEMRESGVEPNGYTFVALLTACMRLLDLDLGSQTHALSIKTGYFNCSYVANALMGLYGKCDRLESVIKVFDEMPERDVASWNTVISFLVKDGLYNRAFELFLDMLMWDGVGLDYYMLTTLLVACARCSAGKAGMGIHAYAHKLGYESQLSVRNALIEYYAKCGYAEDVETLFRGMLYRDVFTWMGMIGAYMGFGLVDSAVQIFDMIPEKNCVSYNALLTGFCRNGEGTRALQLFCRMVEEGMELTDFTLTSVLHACGLVKDKRFSEQLQAFILKIDPCTDDWIRAALLDMSTRCGRMADAEKVFRQFPLEQRSSVLVTTMICGYARNAEPEKAALLIRHWQHGPYNETDEITLASVLGVCGELGFQKLGEQFHSFSLKCGYLLDIGVGNSIVSMYSKCGDIEQATKVFKIMPAHDIVSWNSLLAGHIVNRWGDEALNVWKKMQKEGVKPDTITCALIISAYRHTNSNLVEQCNGFFFSMESHYGIKPDSNHFTCLVRVLGYWGLLDEAEETIKKMPFEPNTSVWRALLDSCRVHKDATIGRRTAKEILSMEPQDPSAFILKSNLYSASGRWHCSEQIKLEMKARGLQKFPVRTWTIHQSQVHSFHSRDKSHPQTKDIHAALDVLMLECLRAGYIPDTSFVLHEAGEHQKLNFLLYHSGKLAVTYGLLVNAPGKPVRVVKNVHLCGDCHTFFKYVSVLTKREIQVRDASGFHCFVNGECSCRDFW